jgi:hypothetical protein
MALTLPSNARQVLASSVMVVFVALLAMMIGVVIVMFPPSFSAALIAILGLLVMILMAAILPSHLDAPGGFLRGMLAIVLVVSVVWPNYVTYKFGSAPGISPTRLVYWGLITLWSFWLMASPPLRNHLFAQLGQFKWLHAVLIAYIVWSLVTAAFSVSTVYSTYYLVKLLLGGYLFYMIVLSILRDADDVERVITWIVVAAALVSLIGMAEGFRRANLFAGIFPTDPEQLETLEWIVLDKSRSGAYRVASTFSHPLAFAEYLTMCLPLAAYLCLNGQTRMRVFIGYSAVPLILVGLYLSRTRSAFITAAVVAATLIVIAGVRAASQRKNFFVAVAGAFAIAAVITASIAGVGILTELAVGRETAERGSTNARIYMMARGSSLVAEEPVTGYGPGRAGITLGALPGHVIITIDNYYLSVALETGLLGLALLMMSLAYPITVGLFRGLTYPGRTGWLALALASGILAFAIERSVLSLTNNLDFSLMLTGMLMIVEQQIRTARKAEGYGNEQRRFSNAV